MRAGLGKSEVETKELFELVSFSSTVRKVQVLQSNISNHMFNPELLWLLHQCYINRLYRSRDVNLDKTSLQSLLF